MPHVDTTQRLRLRCPERVFLEGFLRGEIAATEELERHLDACVACQQRLDQLALAAKVASHQEDRPSWTPSDDLWQRLGRLPTPQNASSATQPAVMGLPDIPGYQLIRILGEGGMGVVYEGIQKNLGRAAAVKTLRAQHVTAGLASRLRRE